jgi:2-dehydropantoate 2-reductase
MTSERILVMGAGSMGTMLGARLTAAGFAVELADVNREHVEALNARGASVVGTVTWNVPVRAITPDQMQGDYDLVFLLVKQTHNATAFAQIGPHLASDGIVCTLQNGIPEPAVAAAFGATRTLGCAVTWAATYRGPGAVEATSAPGKWHAALGTVDGTGTERAVRVQKILSTMCPTQLVSDMAGIRWSKLLVNASFSGMSTALGCTFGEILDDQTAFKAAQYIARECIRVAGAQGIEMAELSPGVDFAKLMDFESEEQRLGTSGIYRQLWGAARAGKASMLQDVEHGRRSEIDFINGVVGQIGRENGVPTPVNDTVVRVVKGIEAGRLRPGMKNLARFDLPSGSGQIAADKARRQ